MRPSRHSIVTGLAAMVAIATLSVGSAAALKPGLDTTGERGKGGSFAFAVIGDVPYGDPQVTDFPKIVKRINADPAVQLVNHLGDIKSGSSRCDDSYFLRIKKDFDTFVDPLVYTVGDNEWTDCHRLNNGAYNPLERLAAIRSLFFARPGHTLGGHPARVLSQASQGYPENVRYTRGEVAFAALHIVGSNNSLAPWTGNTAPTPEQSAEVLGRTAAVIASIRDTFAQAREERSRSVVLLTQADMFDPTVLKPTFADNFAFQPIVRAIAQESASFRGPVYLFNGDSHVFNEDKPLAATSKWLSFYGLDAPVKNLSRVTVDGGAGVNNNNYLRVTIDPRNPDVLSWTKVPTE